MSRGWEKKGHYYRGTMDGPDVLPDITENWPFALFLFGVAAIIIAIITYWPW